MTERNPRRWTPKTRDWTMDYKEENEVQGDVVYIRRPFYRWTNKDLGSGTTEGKGSGL